MLSINVNLKSDENTEKVLNVDVDAETATEHEVYALIQATQQESFWKSILEEVTDTNP